MHQSPLSLAVWPISWYHTYVAHPKQAGTCCACSAVHHESLEMQNNYSTASVTSKRVVQLPTVSIRCATQQMQCSECWVRCGYSCTTCPRPQALHGHHACLPPHTHTTAATAPVARLLNPVDPIHTTNSTAGFLPRTAPLLLLAPPPLWTLTRQ
jgi:hypothetical protein